MSQQQQDWWSRKTIHAIGQKGNVCVVKPEEQNRIFDVVRVKHINLHNIKSAIITKLECSTSQTHTVYKIDTGPSGNLMPLRFFKNSLPHVNNRSVAYHKK